MLQSALRITYTSPQAMTWVTEFLRSAGSLSDNSNGESFFDDIQDYCRGRVRKALNYFDNTGGNNAYRNMEHIVYAYLDYILWRDGYGDIIKPYSDWKFSSRDSLEHFYPQNPIGKHEKMPTDSLHNFGNLCLVDVSTNANFGNSIPSAKVDNYPYIIEKSLKLKIMKEHANMWTPSNQEIIISHGDDMLGLLYKDIANAPQN